MTKFLWPLAVLAAVSACNVSSNAQSAGNGAAVQSTVSPTTLEQPFNVFLTGYSYWDNTPPGSSAISNPVVHRRAGGTGTYNDPITIAVGHVITGPRDKLDYPEGTRFYLKRLHKYVIVEDTCGDGNRPQDGPCHSGKNGMPWLDIYVDGAGASSQTSEQCMNKITGNHQIIMNPRADYPVVVGALTASGCQVFSG